MDSGKALVVHCTGSHAHAQRYCVLWHDKIELHRVSKDFGLIAHASAMLLRAAAKPSEPRKHVFEIVSPTTHW
jgi:hypothetical protein